MSDLSELQADLKYAADRGGELAGKAAVRAGVREAESPALSLYNMQSVTASFPGPLHATVTAAQPAGITPAGPTLPSSDHLAEVMADTAADAGLRAVKGRR